MPNHKSVMGEAAVWLRKRSLPLSLAALGAVVLAVAAIEVMQLSEYPARQASALHRSIELAGPADLSWKDRLELEKDLLQYETDSRVKIWTAIVQAVGGGALLLGLLFTWRNLRATQAKLDIDREGQLTNRFTQATTQLGAQQSDGKANVEARLGGIYALSWIAKDSPANYWPVVEILTAYVRHRAAWPPAEPAASVVAGAPRQPRADVQAVLRVLGRFTPPEAKGLRPDQKIDLRFTDLRGAEFWDAYMENTDFWGAHLEGAKFWGARLDNTKLVNAHLEGANLRGAQFAGADLTGACLDQAELEGADLRFAQGLTQAQVARALLGAGALLPPLGDSRPWAQA